MRKKHRWTPPVWKQGRVVVGKDGNDDMTVWRMNGKRGSRDAYVENIGAEYDTREEMGR